MNEQHVPMIKHDELERSNGQPLLLHGLYPELCRACYRGWLGAFAMAGAQGTEHVQCTHCDWSVARPRIPTTIMFEPEVESPVPARLAVALIERKIGRVFFPKVNEGPLSVESTSSGAAEYIPPPTAALKIPRAATLPRSSRAPAATAQPATAPEPAAPPMTVPRRGPAFAEGLTLDGPPAPGDAAAWEQYALSTWPEIAAKFPQLGDVEQEIAANLYSRPRRTWCKACYEIWTMLLNKARRV